jgi:hypothetical protein
VLASVLGDPVEADDLVEDVFGRLPQALATYEWRAQLRATIDSHRRARGRRNRCRVAEPPSGSEDTSTGGAGVARLRSGLVWIRNPASRFGGLRCVKQMEPKSATRLWADHGTGMDRQWRTGLRIFDLLTNA